MTDTLDRATKNKMAEAGTVEQALNVLDDYLVRELNLTSSCRSRENKRDLRKVRAAVRRASEVAEEMNA
jgi:hypothetical protein